MVSRMSYESEMLEQFAMPSRSQIEQALLRVLLRNGGVIKGFAHGQKIVEDIADEFGLNQNQRSAFLQTIYRKENRVKKALLWHRLLFRAADALAKENLVSRPTQTFQLTGEKEWMLTEKGLDRALMLSSIPIARKDSLPTKSFEVQKIVKKLIEAPPKGKDYDPFDRDKEIVTTTKKSVLRDRGFRQAVIDAYNSRCAVCGMKIISPDSLSFEVEAAHIVPNRSLGRDDICNGIALCRLHHWAFDVGWFTLLDSYKIQTAPKAYDLPVDAGSREFFRLFTAKARRIGLPARCEIYPHPNALRWHRENIFHY